MLASTLDWFVLAFWLWVLLWCISWWCANVCIRSSCASSRGVRERLTPITLSRPLSRFHSHTVLSCYSLCLCTCAQRKTYRSLWKSARSEWYLSCFWCFSSFMSVWMAWLTLSTNGALWQSPITLSGRILREPSCCSIWISHHSLVIYALATFCILVPYLF